MTDPAPATVTGRDGKQYPARPPTLDERNKERAARGLPPVKKARKLTAAEVQHRTIRQIIDRLEDIDQTAADICDSGLDPAITGSEAAALHDTINDAYVNIFNLEVLLLDRYQGTK